MVNRVIFCDFDFSLVLSFLFCSQIITIDEAKRRQSFGSYDADLSMDALPILNDTSDLLQDTHIEKVTLAFSYMHTAQVTHSLRGNSQRKNIL